MRFERNGFFLQLTGDSDARWEYTVAWIDSVATPGRGVFLRGEHYGSGQGRYLQLH